MYTKKIITKSNVNCTFKQTLDIQQVKLTNDLLFKNSKRPNPVFEWHNSRHKLKFLLFWNRYELRNLNLPSKNSNTGPTFLRCVSRRIQTNWKNDWKSIYFLSCHKVAGSNPTQDTTWKSRACIWIFRRHIWISVFIRIWNHMDTMHGCQKHFVWNFFHGHWCRHFSCSLKKRTIVQKCENWFSHCSTMYTC